MKYKIIETTDNLGYKRYEVEVTYKSFFGLFTHIAYIRYWETDTNSELRLVPYVWTYKTLCEAKKALDLYKRYGKDKVIKKVIE